VIVGWIGQYGPGSDNPDAAILFIGRLFGSVRAMIGLKRASFFWQAVKSLATSSPWRHRGDAYTPIAGFSSAVMFLDSTLRYWLENRRRSDDDRGCGRNARKIGQPCRTLGYS